MSFFDDLGKKITQAGQSAVQKTKDMTDVAKINSSISGEEKKIDNIYYQIGKLYVAVHGSDYEPDFAGLVESVKESEQKISNYRRQIQDIKGIVRCEKCGAEVAGNVAFCSSCGSPMPKNTVAAEENTVRCIACGQMMQKDMRFCISCGRPMNIAAQAQAPVQPQAQAPVQPQSQAPVQPQSQAPTNEQAPAAAPAPSEQMSGRVCPNCGAHLAEDLSFCTECGTKL